MSSPKSSEMPRHRVSSALAATLCCFPSKTPHFVPKIQGIWVCWAVNKARFLIDLCLVIGFDANSDQIFWGPLQKGLKEENNVEPYPVRQRLAEPLGHRQAAAQAASGQGICNQRADAMGRRDPAFVIRC